jgi:hypothetical protein
MERDTGFDGPLVRAPRIPVEGAIDLHVMTHVMGGEGDGLVVALARVA